MDLLSLKAGTGRDIPIPHLDTKEIPTPRSHLMLGCCINKSSGFWSNGLLHHYFRSSVFIIGVVCTNQLLSWIKSKGTKVKKNKQRVDRVVGWDVVRTKGNMKKKKQGTSKVRDWTAVPQDLLCEIAKRLMSRVDILHFRSVCRRWRSALPHPTRFPLWVPPLPIACQDWYMSAKLPCFITEVTTYSVDIGSDERVLMQFQELDEPGKFFCYALVPRKTQFTPLSIGHQQLSRLSFVARSFQLCNAAPRFDSHNKRVEGKLDFHDLSDVSKIVIISSKADGADPRFDPLSELSVVALFERESEKALGDLRLGLLRLKGSQGPNWDWDTDFCDAIFEDIAAYKGQLCAIDSSGRAFMMDYNSLEIFQITGPLSEIQNGWKELVEVRGDMFLFATRNNVLFRRTRRVEFKVYKLSTRLRSWIPVESLGNRVVYGEENYPCGIRINFLPIVYEMGMVNSLLPEGSRNNLPLSLKFAHFITKDDEETRASCERATGSLHVQLDIQHCIPWLAPMAVFTAKSKTSLKLSEYEKSIYLALNLPQGD